MISDIELGWLAGILEGEGWFGLARKCPCIRVNMTDEDIMIRLSSLLGEITGKEHKLYMLEKNGANDAQCYRVQVSADAAKRVMRLVVRHMGHRRRQRIWQTLNGYVPKQKKIDITKLRLISGSRAEVT